MEKRNYCLLNTRPTRHTVQAKALDDLVLQDGGASLSCPTLQIEMFQGLSFEWGSFDFFDKIIFISQNAVLGFFDNFKEILSTINLYPKIYAIGLATADSLVEHGLKVENLESLQFDSESLVKQEGLEDLTGQKVLIVKGRGGRQFLENTLQEKGARVFLCDVYERKVADFCAEAWLKFKQANIPIILWTSVASFVAFKQQLEQQSGQQINKNDFSWASKQSCVVFSERIKIELLAQGWQGNIVVVSTQSNQGIVTAIQKII